MSEQQGTADELAESIIDFFPQRRSARSYVRLRWGHEYSGDWVVSSPRNLPNVAYELHDACLARDPMLALNKMCEASFRPVPEVPRAPRVADSHTDRWEIMLW